MEEPIPGRGAYREGDVLQSRRASARPCRRAAGGPRLHLPRRRRGGGGAPHLRRAGRAGARPRRLAAGPGRGGRAGAAALPAGPRFRRRLLRLPLRRRRGGARLSAALGRRTLPRLRAIAGDARPTVVLTTAGARSPAPRRMAGRLPGAAPALRWVATDELARDGLAADWRDPGAAAGARSPSSSTPRARPRTPKGVMVSHGNLLHNEEMIRPAFGAVGASRWSWAGCRSTTTWG